MTREEILYNLGYTEDDIFDSYHYGNNIKRRVEGVDTEELLQELQANWCEYCVNCPADSSNANCYLCVNLIEE